MKVLHELSGACVCPVDGEPDRYRITIEADAVIKVEAIIQTVSKLAKVKLFQEEFTARLARALGVTVTTIGFHSGVKTTCRVGHE